MKEEVGKTQHSRRQFIQKAALGTAALAIAGTFGSCTPPEPEKMIGSLADLNSQGSISAEFNGDSILALQNAKGEITIFSLVCSHKRCTVKWKSEVKEFHCPCHEGKYNAVGNVIDGPPPGPLRRFAYEIREGNLWVLNKLA